MELNIQTIDNIFTVESGINIETQECFKKLSYIDKINALNLLRQKRKNQIIRIKKFKKQHNE